VPDFVVAACVIEIMYRVYTVVTERSSMTSALDLIDSSLPPDVAQLFKTLIQAGGGDDLAAAVREVVMASFMSPAFPPGELRVYSYPAETVHLGHTRMEEGWIDWGGDHLYMYQRGSDGCLLPICVKYSLIRSLVMRNATSTTPPAETFTIMCIGLSACPDHYSSPETFDVQEDNWIVLRFNQRHLDMIQNNVFPILRRLSPKAFREKTSIGVAIRSHKTLSLPAPSQRLQRIQETLQSMDTVHTGGARARAFTYIKTKQNNSRFRRVCQSWGWFAASFTYIA
jgi:hypothetical protein